MIEGVFPEQLKIACVLPFGLKIFNLTSGIDISSAFLVNLPSAESHMSSLMINQHWLDNGLVQSGNKPLPQLILIPIYVAILCQ